VLISNALEIFGLHPFALGSILVTVNCTILAMSASWCLDRYFREKEERTWRNALTSQQLEVLQNVMGGGTDKPGGGGGGGGANARRGSVKELDILKHQLLNPKDVELMKRVGAGSFGEVFLGRCKGQLVAVKSMLDVTEKNAQAFRSEILLTATLKHPNIVSLISTSYLTMVSNDTFN
jgi:hypothetical protein